MRLIYYYVDTARELADYAVIEEDGGACGSNWQPHGEATPAAILEAKRWLAEMLADGYSRGHETAPTF